MVGYRVAVGAMEIVSLSDGTAAPSATSVFPKVSRDDWSRYPGALSADGKLSTNFGCFILRSQGRTILVDTGNGPDFPGRLLQELPAKGLSTDEVDVVVITHLHPDHVGWNLSQKGGQALLTFPKAKYWITKKDWDHFCKPEVLKRSAHIKSMVLPLEELGALRLVEGEASISSEVTVVPTPGHTPGHMSVAIASQGQRGFITGDMVNYPVQVQETAWECTFDWDHGQARRTREAMLERLEMEGALIGAGHFLPPSFGRLVRTEGRRRWQGL